MCFRTCCNVFHTFTSQFVIFHLFSLFSSSRLVVVSGVIVKDLEAIVKWPRGCWNLLVYSKMQSSASLKEQSVKWLKWVQAIITFLCLKIIGWDVKLVQIRFPWWRKLASKRRKALAALLWYTHTKRQQQEQWQRQQQLLMMVYGDAWKSIPEPFPKRHHWLPLAADADAAACCEYTLRILRSSHTCDLLRVNYCMNFSPHSREKWVQNPLLDFSVHAKVYQNSKSEKCAHLVQPII